MKINMRLGMAAVGIMTLVSVVFGRGYFKKTENWADKHGYVMCNVKAKEARNKRFYAKTENDCIVPQIGWPFR